MKTKILTTAILVAFLATTGLAQAPVKENNEYNVDVQLNTENLIVVRFVNTDNDKLKIKVFNEDNKQVYSKSLRAEGNVKVKFDMEELPLGTYYFKLYSNKKELCTEQVSKLSLTEITIPERIYSHEDFNEIYVTQN